MTQLRKRIRVSDYIKEVNASRTTTYRLRGRKLMQELDPRQLTADLGGKWHQSYGVAPCPICQPQRRKDQNALSIKLSADRLLLHCKKAGCAFRDILTAAGIAPGHFEVDEAALAAAAHRDAENARIKLQRARSIWDYGVPIEGTKGEAYLRGSYCTAMIANVTPTGGVHRTFFSKKGGRLSRDSKMMLGPCAGGGVALSEEQGPLVVCEGVETGLSLLSGLLDGRHRVVAALSTSGIKGYQLPHEPGQLIIAADGDMAGEDASSVLGRRAHALGWEVSLMLAPSDQDWNDVLQSGVAA